MRRTLLIVAAAVVVLAAVVVGFLVSTGQRADIPSVSAPAPATPGGTGGISVAPVRSLVTGDQTDTTIDYSVSNSSDTDRDYTISVVELSADGPPLSDGPQSAARWVSLDSTSLTVPAGGTGQFPVRIRPADDRGASERRIGVTVTDNTVDDSGNVSFNVAISTSIYVEGTGESVRKASLAALDLPLVSGREITASAELTNEGTVILVPGAQRGTILGTTSSAEQFTVSGDVVRPGETVTLTGAVTAPIACWCEIRITAPDGEDGYTTVSGRVLVLPWPWILGGLVTLGAVLVLWALRSRRKRA